MTEAINADEPPAARTRDQGTAATYRRAWDAAIGTNPQIITITSFNEWHEGSQIEPAVAHSAAGNNYPGYAGGPLDYLNRTAEAVQKFQQRLALQAAGGCFTVAARPAGTSEAPSASVEPPTF